VSPLVNLLVGAAAVIVAAGVIRMKVLRPMWRIIRIAERMLPLLNDLTVQLGGTPGAFAVLNEVVGQLRTDSGSSLKDTVNRLDAAAIANTTAAEILKINVEVVRQLATQDRELAREDRQQLARLVALLEASGATARRIEVAQTHVADDLAASHRAADGVGPGPHGAAADAASRTPPEP
jgi:hypothetical protein